MPRLTRELITNLCTQKRAVCHRAEVAKYFQYCTPGCVFCNVIGDDKGAIIEGPRSKVH